MIEGSVAISDVNLQYKQPENMPIFPALSARRGEDYRLKRCIRTDILDMISNYSIKTNIKYEPMSMNR